jgi:hypothetical protein
MLPSLPDVALGTGVGRKPGRKVVTGMDFGLRRKEGPGEKM